MNKVTYDILQGAFIRQAYEELASSKTVLPRSSYPYYGMEGATDNS